jgi:hypothetical protein
MNDYYYDEFKTLKKRVKILGKFKKIAVGIIILLVVFAIFCNSRRVNAASTTRPDNLVYTSYEIQKGDTLWDIAESHKWSGCSTKKYIAEVKRINQMGSSEIIYGHYIILPIEAE